MNSEYLIFEKLMSNLVIEKCDDKNIRFYLCQIIGQDTDGYGGYSANEDMVNFIETEFEINFTDEGGFQPGFLLSWIMYDCSHQDILKILSKFNLHPDYLYSFNHEKFYWGTFFLPKESGVKKNYYTGIENISFPNNLIIMTNGVSNKLYDIENVNTGDLLTKLLSELSENHEFYSEDFSISNIELCENNQVIICFEDLLDDDQGSPYYILIEYFNNEITKFEEFSIKNPCEEQNIKPLDNSLAKKVEILLKTSI